MKAIMYFFSFVLLTAMTFKSNVSPGDPIGGKDIKLGRKPPGGIIASGVTDNNGTVEFKNLSAGTGYYVEYGIKEQGIKASDPVPNTISKVKVNEADLARQRAAATTPPVQIQLTQFAATGTINTATNRQAVPQVITQKSGDNQITVTCQDSWIRVKVTKAN